MSYSGAIKYLYDLQKYGTKFGLDNINRLLINLNNPHKSFLSIHVAGTNGKGSTSAIIASLLSNLGFRVGLFTSPHMLNFTERIRINNEEISEKEVVNLTEEIKNIIGKISDFSPTFFEVVTAIAFLYFKRGKVDIAVVEVGMGGRLDATNVLIPVVSVITHISYDHKEFLGDTLEEIASEKAGIIKTGIPVVSSNQEESVEKILRVVAEDKRAPFYLYGRDFFGRLRSLGINGVEFDYHDNALKFEKLFVPLTGAHQLINACTAIKAVNIFLESKFLNCNILSKELKGHIGKDFIYEGLKDLKWQGRIELIGGNLPILIDGAHNSDSACALANTINDVFKKRYDRFIVIFGIMADKDIAGIMTPFLSIASEIIVTAPSYSRAATPDKLFEIAKSIGFKEVHKTENVKGAIEKAKKIFFHNSNSTLIIITGSFYTIGEAKEVLYGKGILTNLRE